MSLRDLIPFLRRPPTPRTYARLLIKKLAVLAPGEPVRFDADGFRLLVGVDGNWVINLHNLYPEYCAAGRHERVRHLERAASFVCPSGIPASFAEALPHLMPALRGHGMAEYLRLRERGKDPAVPSGAIFLPFSSDTALLLVHDGPHTMQTFGHAQLEQWGVSVDVALAAAMDNLRDATVERFTQPVRGVFAGSWNDAYDSSRLLLPDLAHRISGASPLAMVPARGTLLLASGNDRDGVRAMVDYACRIADTETRPVSALLYRYENGRAVEHVPDDELARAGLAHLARQYRYGDYAAQKETLEALYEQNGTDILVAGYKVMREQASGPEYSVCVWTRGVDTLLPRTEQVALLVHGTDPGAPEPHEHVLVPWDVLQAACGALMEPLPDAFPERYRVTAFPDLDLVRALARPTLS